MKQKIFWSGVVVGFKAKVSDEILTISLPEELTEDGVADFKRQINGWLLNPVDAFVLDFKDTKKIDRSFYQIFLQLRSILKSNEKMVYSINLDPGILKKIKSDGMGSALSPVDSLEVAKERISRPSTSKKTIDLDFVKPFLVGVKSTFDVRCKTPVQPLKPYIKTGPIEGVAIASTLSLTSSSVQGMLTLSFPESVFLKVYENMFDKKQESITGETEGVAAELLNIIYGAAKVELNKNGYSFPKALPAVLRGQSLVVKQTSRVSPIVIPFEGAGGIIYLEIEFEKVG